MFNFKKKWKNLKHSIIYIIAYSSIRDYVLAKSPYNYFTRDDIEHIHRTVLWYVAYRFKYKRPMVKAFKKTGYKRF